MSDDNTRDANEPSLASAGSHGEPIGWQRTDEFGRPHGFLAWKDGETRWPKSQTVPLYLAPQPTLTDADREAIGRASFLCDQTGLARSTATLRELLKRLG
jgi:hypothetical protein